MKGVGPSTEATDWMSLEHLVSSRGHRLVQNQPRDSGSRGSGTVSLGEFICKIFFSPRKRKEITNKQISLPIIFRLLIEM